MLNLGILAHVDAGKTSLTERLLFDAGAIATMGAVDSGSTQTDRMALERRRGITIRSAVATFTAGDTEIHLIDTPGHPDFIAEVERALGVLDGAILVVSAVEGVQAQTRILMRTLRAAKVPTLLFVNKIDRRGARHLDLLADIRRLLTPAAIALSEPADLGTPAASAMRRQPTELAETLAEHSDFVLASYLDGSVVDSLLHKELRAQAHAALVHPVFFGSAITGAGIDDLRAGITEFLPAAQGDDGAPVDGTVFAIERDAAGGRSAVVRLFTGTLGTRDRVTFSRRDTTGTPVRESGKATAVRAPGGRLARVGAGGIAYVTGLPGIRVGDRLGSATAQPALPRFRPPTLETVVTAADRPALFLALTELAAEDPLIDLRPGAPGELTVSLYGEVQREVIAARLADEYGIDARFSVPRTVCVERPTGVGHGLEEIGRNHFPATVGLRIEPMPADSGVRYGIEVERGSLPRAFMTAIEETVHRTLREGLRGWQVVDCRITLTHTAYWSPITVAGDFRDLTPLVLMAALSEAGTAVCEPWDRAEIEVPTDALSPVLTAIGRCGGLPDEPIMRGETCVLPAALPVGRVRELEKRLPGLTGGSGVLTSRFDGYHPVRGQVPVRPRTDHNPLDRDEYLLHVLGRS
jgi:ribosomal protection tetracycline resistance protein